MSHGGEHEGLRHQNAGRLPVHLAEVVQPADQGQRIQVGGQVELLAELVLFQVHVGAHDVDVGGVAIHQVVGLEVPVGGQGFQLHLVGELVVQLGGKATALVFPHVGAVVGHLPLLAETAVYHAVSDG